ncbi:MAG: cation transporter [Oscillospiraceae bacterium]|nr:cation transporter [Oscillospiraceae bacterium]
MKRKLSSEEIFKTMTVPQAIRTMAVPAVVSMLIVLIYNLADTFYIGQTNDPQRVAGVSLILPLFNISLAIGSLFGMGGGALIPKMLAFDRREEASRIAVFCVRMAFFCACVFSVAVLCLLRPILTLLGAGTGTYPHARVYVLMVLVAGGVPTVVTNVLSNLLRSFSLSREASIGVALGGVLNIALDPLFMFVLLPPGNEVLGIGIATCLSNCISCAYCIYVFCFRQREIAVNFLAERPEAENRKFVVTVGFSGTLGMLLFDVDYMVLDRLAAGFGDTALAAIGIVLKAERLPQQIGVGLCQGVVPLIAYSYALRDYRRTREIMAYTLKTGAVISVVSIAVYELLAPQIVRFFIQEPETLAIGTQFLRIRTLAAAIMFFCFFSLFLFQGFGNGKVAFWLAVIRWVGLNIPMLFVFRALFGMIGLVWSQVFSDFLTVTLSNIYLWHFMKRWRAEETGGELSLRSD